MGHTEKGDKGGERVWGKIELLIAVIFVFVFMGQGKGQVCDCSNVLRF
jgi:hypothetical protein